MNRYPNRQDVERAQKISKRREIIKFLRKYMKYIWPFIPSLILFVILQFTLKSYISNNNANYILSSITQGLASLVALLFVIMFFLCQSTGKVSMLSLILKDSGYFLLSIFIISIMLPLITIKIGYTVFLVDLSISMCFFCLLSLFPFVSVVNEITKGYGISEIIAELEGVELPKDNIKYRGFIDDLRKVGPEDIIKLVPHESIDSLIKILNRSINSKTNFINEVFSMRMLANIGMASLIEGGSKGHFYDVIQIIDEILFENCSITKNKSKQLFARSLAGVSQILSKLKLHKKLDKDIRLYFAEVLMNSSFEIFNKLKNIREQERGSSEVLVNRIIFTLKENQRKLEGVILAYLKREMILIGDYRKVFEGYDEEFKKYMENILNLQKQVMQQKILSDTSNLDI